MKLYTVVWHRLEQNRVTWETPSSEAIPLLQKPIGLLRAQSANAGMKRTSVVEHNLYFAQALDRGINKRSKPKGLRQN
jgi:hypothetical protein